MALQSTVMRCLRCKDVVQGTTTFLRQRATLALDSPVSEAALSHAMPFESIPGPKALPLIGNMNRYLPWIGEYSTKYWHDSQRLKYEQFGDIVREIFLPGICCVHIYNPKDIEAVTRYEGKYPKRDFFLGMKKLREENAHIYGTVGIAPGNGEEWYRVRSSSQKAMMRPQVMRQFLPQMNTISEEFVQRMKRHRNADLQVPDYMQELFKWALESVTYIMFNQRMGCLKENLEPDSMGLKYINALNEFFQSTARVELTMVPIWKIFPSLSPAFRKLSNVHNFFFENAMVYVKEAMKKVEQQKDDEEMSLIQSLLRYSKPEDAAVMAIDSMAAGIDTTSLSVAYVLRNLAANPEAQERLQKEVDSVVPKGKDLTTNDIEKMPYLRACIKESMRLTPTVQGTSRTLQRDMVLSGYRVPEGTPITMNYFVACLQEENFPDAEKYKPERWIRSGGFSQKESFAFQPFGFGPRMCIGRRIADLEMLALITKIVQNFWVENKSKELDINFQLVLMIKSPLRYEFHDRK